MANIHNRMLFAALCELKEVNDNLRDRLESEVIGEADSEIDTSDLISQWDEVVTVALQMRNAFCDDTEIALQDADLTWDTSQVMRNNGDDE